MERLNNNICYVFARECVEAQDFSRFFSDWGPDKLPEGSALWQYVNAFVFSVDGYDDDPRELVVIPEVRAFYRAFNSQWPFWFFACNLDVPNVQTMTLCCLKNLRVVQRKSEKLFRVDFLQSEMHRFLRQECVKMEILCQRAGMSPEEINRRYLQVLEFYRRSWPMFTEQLF